jgi:hypothetical protein
MALLEVLGEEVHRPAPRELCRLGGLKFTYQNWRRKRANDLGRVGANLDPTGTDGDLH